MSTWNAVMTTAGLALQAKLTAGATLNITKAQAGSGTVSASALASQTSVSSVKQTMNLRYAQAANGVATIACYLRNDNLTTGYTVNQIGIFANDPDNGEILYFICQATSGNGSVIPSATELPGFTAEWNFSFSYGNAESVSVTVDPANTVSQAQVQVLISQADLAASQITSGTIPVARGGTGQTSVDNTPTSGSSKMVTSGGVYNAINSINATQIKAGTLPVARGGTGQTSVDTTPTSGSARMVTSGGVYTALAGKQSTIKYGTAAPSGGSNGDVYVRYS